MAHLPLMALHISWRSQTAEQQLPSLQHRGPISKVKGKSRASKPYRQGLPDPLSACRPPKGLILSPLVCIKECSTPQLPAQLPCTSEPRGMASTAHTSPCCTAHLPRWAPKPDHPWRQVTSGLSNRLRLSWPLQRCQKGFTHSKESVLLLLSWPAASPHTWPGLQGSLRAPRLSSRG